MKIVNGFYTVNKEVYYNKISALIRGTELNTLPEYHYFDDIFGSVNVKSLGSKPLTELYLERAKQLRDKYDYLILCYSGGSDSHNILHTFLKNNIKLDCVFVHWHFKFLDKNFYIPNSIDNTSINFNSEWDLVIKKDLEFLYANHPDIKIELKDYTDTANKNFYSDKLFETNSNVMTNISRGLKLHTHPNTEKIMVDKGLTVGCIYGAEKPSLVVKQNKAYVYFVDKGFCAIPNPINPEGLEYFYINPDLPQLTMEQSLRLLGYYKQNVNFRYLFQAKSERVEPDFKDWSLNRHLDEYKLLSNIVKKVCYPYWDFKRFQADKAPPETHLFLLGFKQWDNILVNHDDFVKYSQIWKHHWKDYYKLIHKNWMWSENEHMVIKTKWHYLGTV